jgi:Clr5 domain
MALRLVWKLTEAWKPRAQRKTEPEWEKHKDVIIHRYRSSTLNEVVEWMIHNHDFRAKYVSIHSRYGSLIAHADNVPAESSTKTS